MLRVILILTALVLLVGYTISADLNLTGATNQTIENQTYGQAVISGCTNVTIRNCNFSSNSGIVVSITGGSDGITLENCDINGLVNACTGINIDYSANCKNVTVKGCHIHNIADDGIQMHRGTNMKFYDNVIHQLHGCGTDNGCGPCNNGHSDGFEIANSTNCEFKRNLVYDIKSTSCFFMDNTGSTERGILMENNIFFPAKCGFCMYLQYCDGMELYHNTMWRGTVGGVCLGPSALNVTCNNNIFSTINLNHLSVTFNPTHHQFDYNLIGLASQGMSLQPHDTYSPNPLFQNIPAVIGGTLSDNVIADDFKLQPASPAINKGTSGGNIPTTDFFGNPRVGAPDLGAIEYQGTGLDLDIDQIAEIKLKGVALRTNPFADEIRVAAETFIRSLELYGTDGKLLCRSTGVQVLPTPEVAPGVCLLKVEKQYRTVWVKVVKQ